MNKYIIIYTYLDALALGIEAQLRGVLGLHRLELGRRTLVRLP